MRVGNAVQVLPLISPLRIAEEAATVDQVSQGRFEFGVGRSGNANAYEIMGIPYEESPARFQEALDIILEAWKGTLFLTTGSTTTSTTPPSPRVPTRNPGPRCGWPPPRRDSFARVGRLGFPIFLSVRGMDVNDLENNLKEYHKAWREAGHPGDGGDIQSGSRSISEPPRKRRLPSPRRPPKRSSLASDGCMRNA